MTDKILIVTAPDDVLIQGIRIVHVGLTEEQSSIVSSALFNYSNSQSIINYVWKIENSIEWLIDKIYKSDLIIFNAESSDSISLLIGWISSQPQSYYFGTLRDLHIVNDRILYSSSDILFLLERIAKQNV